MKTNNQYLKTIADEEGHHSNTYYLRKVLEDLTGEDVEKNRSMNYYLKRIAEAGISGGDDTKECPLVMDWSKANGGVHVSQCVTDINFPSDITELPIFQSMTGLTSVEIPNTVTSIPNGCFRYCSNLETIIIPSSITSIGYGFDNCVRLVDYQLYWTGNPVQYNSSKMKTNADTIFTIPNGTTSIYESAGYPSDKLVERE